MVEDFITNWEPGQIIGWITPWIPKLAVALLIFFVGRWAVRLLARAIQAGMTRAGQDPTLVRFVGSLIYGLLLVAVIIAALSEVGFQTTSLIAVLGAAGLAVGLALQGSLANFAAGVMIILFRPFRAGDYVDAGGVQGSVEVVTIFNTILLTPDNRQIIVPNDQIMGGVIVNFSAKETRRVDVSIGISYDDDIQTARRVLLEAMRANERVLGDPEPMVMLTGLGDSSVDFAARAWVRSEDYWDAYNALHEELKVAIEGAGLSIPFPQRDMHMKQVA